MNLWWGGEQKFGGGYKHILASGGGEGDSPPVTPELKTHPVNDYPLFLKESLLPTLPYFFLNLKPL